LYFLGLIEGILQYGIVGEVRNQQPTHYPKKDGTDQGTDPGSTDDDTTTTTDHDAAKAQREAERDAAKAQREAERRRFEFHYDFGLPLPDTLLVAPAAVVNDTPPVSEPAGAASLRPDCCPAYGACAMRCQ
jgi:hypothetical protein